MEILDRLWQLTLNVFLATMVINLVAPQLSLWDRAIACACLALLGLPGK